MRPITGLIHCLETHVRGCGVKVRRAPLPDSVQGRMRENLITVRPELPPLQELAVLVHEFTHWLVHRHPRDGVEHTLFEYEAEAVEVLVLDRLGLSRGPRAPLDGLLPASVARVHFAQHRICEALDLGGDEAPGVLQPQTAVDFQTPTGKEIVFEYEAYGMGDFFGLPEAL